MRAVVQRVSRAKVTVEGRVTGEIGPGLMILLGVGKEDTSQVAAAMAEKVANLRIFEDEQGKMNRSLLDVKGSALVVSQFTLYGMRGGRGGRAISRRDRRSLRRSCTRNFRRRFASWEFSWATEFFRP
jgi:D-tyrosyl-tRNA(Tyr) deacylase